MSIAVGAVVARLSRSRLVRNIGSLYGVQFADYLLPLIVIPYLARVLGPDAWGKLMFYQYLATWLGLILEFGFGFSATRQVAREQGNKRQTAEIVSGVVGANGLLLGALAAVSILLYFVVPSVSADPYLFVLACVSAVFQGARPFWYFQGVERMTVTSALNLGGRLIYTALVFVLVRTAADANRVLSLQVAISGLVIASAFVLLYREVEFVRPRLKESWIALKAGWHMFIFRSTISLYTTANGFILGLLAAPAQVSMFGNAEKLSRVVVGLTGPVSQSLFPKLSYMHKSDPARASRLARLGLIYMTGTAALLGAAMAIFAPILVRFLLGEKFLPAVPVLRILCLLPLAIAVNNSVCTGWLMPMGRDKAVSWVIAIGAGVNLVLAPMMVKNFGASGMAVTVVIAETVIAIGAIVALRIGRPAPALQIIDGKDMSI